ncbi:alpha-taxilin-like protein isoform X2 [Wolffia australiana]
MDSTLESRLPEVDSLPDGFVDCSGEESPRYSFSPKPLAMASSGSNEWSPEEAHSRRVFSDIHSEESAMETVASPSFPPGSESTGEGRRDSAIVVSEPPMQCDSQITGEEKLENTVVRAANLKLKETSAETIPECQPNLQLGVSEAKRKAGKSNMKSGKESSEFNLLRYEKVIAERDAAIAVRDRLESLCRELQRQNKLLMEECKRVSNEGQILRTEFSKKFNDAIEDVSKKLEMQKEECLAQLKENELLRTKLTHLSEQYALSEKAFQEKLKQKMLELQLAELKIQQHQERAAQGQKQRELYVEQISQLLETEKSLRLQLATDGEKFQQFQETLQKSNEVFDTFNKEMKKMTKLVNELKEENTSLKSKSEEKNYSIASLLSERESLKNEIAKVVRQKEKLESLCRTLQAERKKSREASGEEKS